MRSQHVSDYNNLVLIESSIQNQLKVSEDIVDRFSLTSLAMVVMKAGGRAVAMRERACRAERAESAGGLRGRPMVTLQEGNRKRNSESKDEKIS